MNTLVNGKWGREEIKSYDVYKEVNTEVTVTKGGFLVYVNDEFFHFYKARLPWDSFVET